MPTKEETIYQIKHEIIGRLILLKICYSLINIIKTKQAFYFTQCIYTEECNELGVMLHESNS